MARFPRRLGYDDLPDSRIPSPTKIEEVEIFAWKWLRLYHAPEGLRVCALHRAYIDRYYELLSKVHYLDLEQYHNNDRPLVYAGQSRRYRTHRKKRDYRVLTGRTYHQIRRTRHGFWSYKTPDVATINEYLSTGYASYMFVLAKIRISGVVIEHERGYISEYMEIVELYMNTPANNRRWVANKLGWPFTIKSVRSLPGCHWLTISYPSKICDD